MWWAESGITGAGGTRAPGFLESLQRHTHRSSTSESPSHGRYGERLGSATHVPTAPSSEKSMGNSVRNLNTHLSGFQRQVMVDARDRMQEKHEIVTLLRNTEGLGETS